MTISALRFFRSAFKPLSAAGGAFLLLLAAACSVNPATGEKQFTALMPPAQEARTGAAEHEKIAAAYGLLPKNDPLPRHIAGIGAKIAAGAERRDVPYRFFVLDSPVVNAFALPGGYIYVSRGLLALANGEDETAAVLAHETAHITARHAAERYSQGALASIGAAALEAALGSPAAGRAASLGSGLYLTAYSREQESQADELGLRYLARAGYDPGAMARFLKTMDRHAKLEARLAGKTQDGIDFFATHPQTGDRVVRAADLARAYPPAANGGDTRDTWLSAVDGLTYGDSAEQGFVRGRDFYHPAAGFTFRAPEGFMIVNRPGEVIAAAADGTVAVFDSAPGPGGADPLAYLTQQWMRGESVADAAAMDINGMKAATASFPGTVDGKPSLIRLAAIAWTDKLFFRFQAAVPRTADAAQQERVDSMIASLRRLSAQEKSTVRPLRIKIVEAGPQDTADTLAARMAQPEARVERFRVLNGLGPDGAVAAGRRYKIIAE